MDKITKSIIDKTQIRFYLIANYIAKQTVDGFFDDVVHMGTSAMLAVLSVTLIALAIFFFVQGILAMLRHNVDGTVGLFYAAVLTSLAYASKYGALRVLAVGEEADDE